MNTRISRAGTTASEAFTLIELLVVIAAIGILAALLLPGLASGNQQAEGDQCMGGLKELSQAWLMYNSDNQGKLVPNGGEGTEPGGPNEADLLPGGAISQWCPGRQDAGAGPGQLSPVNAAPGGANIGWEYIKAGLIYPYVKNVQAYLCAADYTSVTFFGVAFPRVRTRSMNTWLNPLGGYWNGGPDDAGLRVFLKESDLTVPGPANTFLLIDEAPGSINDAYFVEDPSYIPYPNPSGALGAWVDCPGGYHNNGAGISFTDGHVQIKKWSDLAIQNNPAVWTSSIYAVNGTDCAWLCNRSTALKVVTSFLGPK
jgi:prepilin-type N-terminal cleavage/methylation domain-containing protein/prepilin-type processing-associated H-X9-DG protein